MSHAITQFLLFLLDAALWLIIIQVALSWLIAFNVVNLSNPQARNFVNLLERILSPIYTPLRRIIPPIAGLDLTPLAVIFGIYLLQSLVVSISY